MTTRCSTSLQLWLLASVLCLSSCSVVKLMDDGKMLYNGSSLEIIAADSVPTQRLQGTLEDIIQPKADAKILGWRWRTWFFLKYKTPKEKGLNHWLSTKLGRAPTYYDPALTQAIVNRMQNTAVTKGYFSAHALADTSLNVDRREVDVQYQVSVKDPYHLDSIVYYIADSPIAHIVNQHIDDSHLKKGQVFDVANLKREQLRIQQLLKSKGYYYFQDDDLTYYADTFGNNVDLLLHLHPEVEDHHLKAQTIRNVRVYSDFDANRDNDQQTDTFNTPDMQFLCSQCPMRIKSLSEGIYLERGDPFKPRNYERTLKKLTSFNNFSYIRVETVQVPESDSLMDINVLLTPSKPRTISGEVGIAYNTGGYIGPELLLSYTNRNIFRGAELLNVTANVQLNYLIDRNQLDNFFPFYGQNQYTASVTAPRLWIPRFILQKKRFSYSDTHLELGFEDERSRFRLLPFASAIESLNLKELQDQITEDSSATEVIGVSNWHFKFGYTWSGNPIFRHEINPLTLRLQDLSVKQEEVSTLIQSATPNRDLENSLSLQRMFILSPDYIFRYDRRQKRLHRHDFFLQQRLSMNWTRVSDEATSLAMLAGNLTTFAQIETDFRYYFRISDKMTLATRQAFSIGLPVSERAIIPFFDLYSIGGPNSVRALPPRGAGPGRGNPAGDDLLLLTGFGNVRFEGSVEWRQKLDALFELALFADYGNVWKYRTELENEVGEFDRTTFFDELALGAGAGLRIDLTILLLRLDFAWPLSKPWLEEGQRFVGRDFFKEGYKKPVFILAFGYPF